MARVAPTPDELLARVHEALDHGAVARAVLAYGVYTPAGPKRQRWDDFLMGAWCWQRRAWVRHARNGTPFHTHPSAVKDCRYVR